MWSGDFFGIEAKWHEIIHLYASKITLNPQTGWLCAGILLRMVPENYLFGGELVNAQKMYARESPKIGLTQYLECLNLHSLYY